MIATRRLLIAATAVAVCVSMTAAASARQGASTTSELAGPPATIVQYGYVRALVQDGNHYRLRFDPALWLSGETANRAAIEDGVIPPGDTVPNDYYVRNESRKQLSYFVPRTARVTIVTVPAGGPRSTRMSVSELAAIAKGRNPRGRKLYGRDLGFWVRIAGDRAVELDQQYQP